MAELSPEQRKALALAAARRRRAEAEGSPPRAREDAGWRTTLEAAQQLVPRDFITGLVKPIDPTGDLRSEYLAPAGVANAPGEEPDTALGAGMKLAGEAATYGAGVGVPLALRAGARALTGAPRAAGALGQFADDVGRSVAKRPGAFALTEVSAGFLAGAGGRKARDVAEDEGASPGVRQAAETVGTLAGGVAGGVAPGLAARAGARGAESLAKHVLPFTEMGGRPRAAATMQRRAADPAQAAIDARKAAPGVTPARATGDPRLTGQEQRVMIDDPKLELQVQRDLDAAIERTSAEFKGKFGDPTTRAAWERRVVEETAAPGATIEPGDSDQMLRQAFNSFDTAYQAARGHSIDPTGMGNVLGDAVNDPDIYAGTDVRAGVRGWLNNQLKSLQKTRLADDGTLASDDILSLRQAVRTKQRQLANSPDADNQQARDLFSNVERRLTDTLERQLPDEAAEALRATDARYRQFKTVEDAVYRSGEKPLTPEVLSESIRRRATSQGAYARGDSDQALRTSANAGRRVETVLGEPDEARRMVRDLAPEDLASVKADYAQTLHGRSLTPDEDGVARLSGAKLKAELAAQRETGKALGLSDSELDDMERLADALVTMQRRPGEAPPSLVEDAPAAVMNLLFRWLGARAGQNVSSGTGHALVMAHAFSDNAVKRLNELTSSQATKLLRDAQTDPELYAALLTDPTKAEISRATWAGKKLNAWLLAHAGDEAAEALPPGEAAPPDDMPPPFRPAPTSRPAAGLLE